MILSIRIHEITKLQVRETTRPPEKTSMRRLAKQHPGDEALPRYGVEEINKMSQMWGTFSTERVFVSYEISMVATEKCRS